MSKKKNTYVLIAGSWFGGWYWDEVAEALREKGHKVYTPTLTGLAERSHLLNAQVDLSMHVTDICNLIEWEQLNNIILCGHSYAGLVISGVAEYVPERTIRSIVYLDAAYIESGKSLVDYFPDAPITNDGGSTTPPPPGELFRLKGSAAKKFDDLATPHPLASWEEKSKSTGRRNAVKSKWFIVAMNSGIPIFKNMVEKLEPRSEWIVEELPCAHMVAIELPIETTDILLRAGSA